MTSIALLFYSSYTLLREARRGALLSPLALYSALFILHFSLINLVHVWQESPFTAMANWDYATHGALYLLVCFAAIHIGCRLSELLSAMSPNSMGVNASRWDAKRTILVVAILSIAALAVRIYIVLNDAYFQIARTSQGELEGPLYALVRMVEAFPLQALTIWAIYYFQKRGPSTFDKTVLTLLVLYELFYWLPSGRKEAIVECLLIPAMVRYVVQRKLPRIRTMAVAFLGIVALFPAAFYYRYAIEIGDVVGQGPTEVIADAARNIDLGVQLGEESNVVNVILTRFSLVEPVSAAIRIVDTNVWKPLQGESYLDGLVSLVPRILWPAKPEFHYGTDFGQAGGFLGPLDWSTSISVTFPGEAYLNFGWTGALVMFAIAFALTTIYLRGMQNNTWLLMYFICVPTILYIGGTFALYFGGLLKLVPFFALIAIWLRLPSAKFHAHETPDAPVGFLRSSALRPTDVP